MDEQTKQQLFRDLNQASPAEIVTVQFPENVVGSFPINPVRNHLCCMLYWCPCSDEGGLLRPQHTWEGQNVNIKLPNGTQVIGMIKNGELQLDPRSQKMIHDAVQSGRGNMILYFPEGISIGGPASSFREFPQSLELFEIKLIIRF